MEFAGGGCCESEGEEAGVGELVDEIWESGALEVWILGVEAPGIDIGFDEYWE